MEKPSRFIGFTLSNGIEVTTATDYVSMDQVIGVVNDTSSEWIFCKSGSTWTYGTESHQMESIAIRKKDIVAISW